MKPIAFHKLCNIHVVRKLTSATIHMSIRKQVLMFLRIIGHIVISTKIDHRYFRIVLAEVLKLYKFLIRLASKDTPLEIGESRSDHPPENARELFNPHHSSLRTTIERGDYIMEAAMNQLRTLRTMWSTIQELRKKSGFGWNDNLKMITPHRKHAEYLNKRIEMYDELAIVVGKDMETGSFAKSYVDLETQQKNLDDTENVVDNGEDVIVDKGKNVVESSTIGSKISGSRRRSCAPPINDSVYTDLFEQLKEIVVALKAINQGHVDFIHLSAKVMAMSVEGYSDDMLATVFDHLFANKKAARGFLAKKFQVSKVLDG
ncbi:hypothetical protein ACB092_06G105900 [Castanea dentata]